LLLLTLYTLSSCSAAPNGLTPASDPAPQPPPPLAPLPTASVSFLGDFSEVQNDAELAALVQLKTPANVHAEPGVGMRYDFQPRPERCGDQTLASIVHLAAGTRDLWAQFRVRFSSNWTEKNPGCSSPAPGYKMLISWLGDRAAVTSGHELFDVRHREDTQIHASVPGFSSADAVPLSIVQRTDLIGLADGNWHEIRVHQQLIGDNEALFQLEIDGVVTHNYRTRTTSGLGSNWISQINLGANRNLGAVELMHIWWDDFRVWPADPGMAFPAPDVF